MSTLLVNFYGGPGTGKSTMAARIFAELKDLDINVELVTEYAKDLTWQESYNVLSNQIYVFAKQQHRLWRLRNKVEIILTDSPLLNSIVYNNSSFSLNDLIEEEYSKYNNVDIYLDRVKKYNPKGRSQSEREAINLDLTTREVLEQVRRRKYGLIKGELRWNDLQIAGHRDSVREIVELITERYELLKSHNELKTEL